MTIELTNGYDYCLGCKKAKPSYSVRIIFSEDSAICITLCLDCIRKLGRGFTEAYNEQLKYLESKQCDGQISIFDEEGNIDE